MERPFQSALGALVDPDCYRDPLNVEGYSEETLHGFLEKMLLIRLMEESIADLVTSGQARCPCHLGIGQEAIAVGLSAHLRSTDRVFGGHRSHSHYLSLGGDPYQMLAEVLGKADGCAKGMGGSMHLCSDANGFVGSVPIVGATIPIAVGAAWAAKMDGRGDVGVAYFGDGAAEEGVLHESLNLASQFQLPALFVCENNLYASHLDIQLRQPSDRVSRFADAHLVRSRLVDGNDVVAVAGAARELIQGCRSGLGPAFLEAITYRWRGHVGPDENIDVGVRRNAEDLARWKDRDPIRRLAEAMDRAGLLSAEPFEGRAAGVRARVQEWTRKALEAEYPSHEMLLEAVYAAKGDA